MDASEVIYVLDLVHRATGLDLDADKGYLIDSRLHAIAKDAGFGSVSELILHLRTTPHSSLHAASVQAMLTHETYFFRDPNVFEALRLHIIPQLIRKKAMERTLYFWSAACSTGQEAYSLAMLLDEHFPILRGWDVRIYAADISLRVLEKAKAGYFTPMEMSRGLSDAYKFKYFKPLDQTWQICPLLRQKVEFFPLNLTADAWPDLPIMDVILLRNVMIYFNAATRQALLGRVRRMMTSVSLLILGHSENVLHSDPLFEAVRYDKTVTYKWREAHSLRTPNGLIAQARAA